MRDEWMGKKRNYDAREEVPEFGTIKEGSVRVLRSGVSASVNVNNRIKIANGLWWKREARLKSSRLTKNWQEREVEACVEGSLLYDCQARECYKKRCEKVVKVL